MTTAAPRTQMEMRLVPRGAGVQRNPDELSPQLRMVRNHLLEHGRITPMQAWDLYGIQRLASVMGKLKAWGMEFDNPRVRVKTRNGYTDVTEYRYSKRKEVGA